MFRTYDSNGIYKDFDIVLDGTSSTKLCSSAADVPSTPSSVASVSQLRDTNNDEDATKPVHFRHHQDSWDRKTGEHVQCGDVMAECFAMVHLPIPIKKAMTIPNAKKAVDKE